MMNLSFMNLVNVTILGTSATGFLCLSLLDASTKSLLLRVLSTIVCLMLVRASAATRHWVLVVVSLGVAALATLAATATEKDTINDKDEEIQVKYPYCVVKVDDLEPRSLAEAVAAFNKEAKESPTGALQPPITEQETLAAIAKFIELEHVDDPAKATLREISKTKSLPVNAYFRRFTRFDDEQQMHGVWWVRLVVEGKDPPDYSVPVRTTPVFTRPYTQMERQQNAEKGLTLINRFVSYFEVQPNIRLKEAFAQEAMDRLIGIAKKAIEAKDLAAMKKLFHWQDVSDSTREFVSSELQMLFKATIQSIKIEPRTLNGNLIHWSAFQHYQPNLPVVGFLEVEYTPEDPQSPKKFLSLELGKSGDDFRLVNYITLGERNLPKDRVQGLSIRGNTELLKDGTKLLTDLITSPGLLISAHLANEEIRQRGFENNKSANLAEIQGVDVQDFQGKIVEIRNGIYINLGRADGLRPSVRFGVVNSDESRVADAQPKARIEVVEVISGSEHLSRCKVLSDRTPITILRGDSIYSPAWQPGRKVEFALAGKLDINGDGIDDRETIKAMIAHNGGLVTMDLPLTGKGSGELSVTTRWLVIGDDFKMLDEGGALESRAKAFGISRIHVDKLLRWLRGSRADEHRP